MRLRPSAICMLLVGAFLAGCHQTLPEGAIVLTQTPVGAKPADTEPRDVLDLRYPPGSRVVLVMPPYQPRNVRCLSAGLIAAGSPVVSPDGQRIFFTGRGPNGGDWQIYAADLAGGRPAAMTTMAAGAMDPAVLGNGDLVFCSPVPRPGTASNLPALYAKAANGQPTRLSYGSTAAAEPTVLRDGRILFVATKPASNHAAEASPGQGLYTVNNDGTEVTAYALGETGVPFVHRPRELPGGRVGFLVATSAAPAADIQAESARLANPFNSRGPCFPFPTSRCRSVEAGAGGTLLASLETRGMDGRSMGGSFAVYQLAADAAAAGRPLFDDPAFHDIEATPLDARTNPLGHISVMSPGKTTGTILCLDANFSRDRNPDGTPRVRATRVRVTGTGPAGTSALGEVPVQADGSFMAEVPADVALGFESLDAEGRVIYRLAPFVWVRAGENRSCVGCHEPTNRSPRNLRPLAANAPPVKLTRPATAQITQHSP